MPSFMWSESIGAGAIYRPLDGWQYEYVPAGGVIEILHNATAAGVMVTITAGSDTLQERSPVPAGGTAGVIPSGLNVPVISDEVAAGDRLKIAYENSTVGAITVNGVINYTA